MDSSGRTLEREATPFANPRLLLEHRAAVLYGAGHTGRDAYRVLSSNGVRVLHVLDRSPRSETWPTEVPLSTPDRCPLDSEVRARVPLVLSIFNRDVDVLSLANELRAQGFRQIVSFLDLHALFPDELGDRFWLTDRAVTEGSLKQIRAVESLWADGHSRRVYQSLVNLRRFGSFEQPQRPDPAVAQYMPKDVPAWPGPQPMRFVDCGAFRGDTYDSFRAAGLEIEASAHFEPDLENFVALAAALRRRAPGAEEANLLWPCAVGECTAEAAFAAGNGEGSSLNSSGRERVPVVALDDVLRGWRPTLIKMDVEGAEIDALLGARELVCGSRPGLAICVYHRPDHLWNIPLLLSSWPELSAYKFYLRSHGHSGFDTVLYGIQQNPPCVI